MNVEVKKLPASRWEILVTLSWAEWNDERVHAVEHMAKNLNISGFRQGKVPEAIIEQRFGRQAILVETAEHAVHQSYSQALVMAKAEAIGRPEIKFDTVKEGESLAYTIVTDVLPEIVLRPSWRKEVTEANKVALTKKIEVTDDEVEKEIAHLAKMRATFTSVDRIAQNGDSVKVDFLVSVDGAPIDGGRGKDHALVLGSGTFIPGFEEAIVGMSKGEEKVIELPFPEGYHAKHLAGKQASFEVKLKSIEEQKLPPIDDVFAQSLGHFQSLIELRTKIRSGLVEEKTRALKEEHRSSILEALIRSSDLEYPVILVQEEVTRMLSQFRSQIEGMGLTWEQYLTQGTKTEEDFRKEWEPQAKKRVAADRILQKLAIDESIDVESEAVEAEMNQVFQYYKNVKDAEKNIDMGRLYTSVRDRLVNDKVLSWLEGIGKA